MSATTISPVNDQSQFPCDNFACLMDNFEVMKKSNGYLLIDLKVETSPSRTYYTFHDWFMQFKATERLYGLELDVQDSNGDQRDATVFPCHSFVCLLDKYELLKTSKGYLLSLCHL